MVKNSTLNIGNNLMQWFYFIYVFRLYKPGIENYEYNLFFLLENYLDLQIIT